MKLKNARGMLTVMPDAAVLVDPDQTIVAVNHRAADLFRTDASNLEGASLDILIPELSVAAHRKHVAHFFSRPARRSMGTGLRFHGRRADGSNLPVDIMLNRLIVESSTYVIAVIRDDSERLAMEVMKKQLEAANVRLAKAQDAGGLAWWEVDLTTNRMIWSTTMPRILGINGHTPPSLEAVRDLCVPEDRDHFDSLHRDMRSNSGKKVTFRLRNCHGHIRWLEESVHVETGGTVLGVMRDVTGQKVLEEKLRTESVTDELTGLFNRKQFNHDLKSNYSEFVRSRFNSAIIMYDFDHFKNINDSYGHAMGDRVLSQVATLVRDQLRPSDRAYRLGGEEFAILLRGFSTDDAWTLADRIRRAIEAVRFKLGDTRASVTVSVGIARFRDSDSNYEDSLRRADEALYQSKANSRNTISILE